MEQKIPFFLKKDGLKLKPNNHIIKFFIPEKYFESSYALQNGSYLDTIGIFLYNVYDKNNKKIFNEHKLFYCPTIFTSKPTDITKVADNSIYEDDTHRELLFDYKTDCEVISSIQCIQYATTVEKVLKLFLKGRIPKIIPYERLHTLFNDSAKLNGISFNTIAGLEGLIISESCRSKNDVSKPFILDYADNNKIRSTDYTIVNIDTLPKMSSSYAAFNSYDKTIAVAAALANKKETDESAMEKILLGNF